jgi:hypothetical protein
MTDKLLGANLGAKQEGWMRVVVLLVALAVAGCTANPSREESIRAQAKPFIGQPLTSFVQATGQQPDGYYDTADERRHFTFDKSRFVTAPGYGAGAFQVAPYHGTFRCRWTAETQPMSAAASPDSFRIVSLTAVGC